MYLRVPWWVMYLFSCLSFLKKRNDCAWQTRQVWTFNVASIMILVHTSTVVHSMIRSMRRPLLVLASIITWLGVVFWIRAIGSFVFQDMRQRVDVSSFPKKNIQVWHPNHWTQRPGYSLHALWCLLVSLWEWDGGEEWPFNQERRLAHQAIGKFGCFIVEAGIYLQSLWTYVDFVFLFLGKMPMIAMFSEKTLATIC